MSGPEGGSEGAHACTADDGNASSVLDRLLDEQSEIEAGAIRVTDEVSDEQQDYPEHRLADTLIQPIPEGIVLPSPMAQLPSPEETPRTETKTTLARADMQDFQKALDGVVGKLRTAATDAFMDSRQRITRRHEAESTAAKMHAQATEVNLKETIKALNERLEYNVIYYYVTLTHLVIVPSDCRLSVANDRVATLERQIKGVQFLNHKQRNRQRRQLLMARMMARWKIYNSLRVRGLAELEPARLLLRQLDEKTKSKLSRALYKAKLSSRVFVSWKLRSMRRAAARKQADMELANATLRANESAVWEEERSTLLARIDDFTAELEKEMQTKRMMQDNLKRVFMRGVCALNFEAMSLLGGQPADESEAEEQFDRLFGSASAANSTNPVGAEARPQDSSWINLMARETFVATSSAMAMVTGSEGARKEHNTQSLPFVSYDGSKDREKAVMMSSAPPPAQDTAVPTAHLTGVRSVTPVTSRRKDWSRASNGVVAGSRSKRQSVG
ncbi:hypothetical protein Pmar_PMAR015275 [Perkinsus marinus ATCC 50983]|uniref:Centrosomal protein POC5 n=1 Tax=Perkinsus marinus (strain ATCC 50983 / TXsc) TaxID=423536 RepID=C5KL70_PERM5|nr:hypothetical protein Pmar_PMAR015275 [Perkinsus marinus ATCC 50983]EER14743.1 hypothetical protein Pmar_PMAR015275 [Perkinsus marinus ATCC 50983]|eukprot:XP_002782947.1 hypothetical protein Pmar_PMAR015275 [Perkinsus marinus ATCC 50983]